MPTTPVTADISISGCHASKKSFADFLRWRFSSIPEYSEKAWNNEHQVIADVMDRIAGLDPRVDFLVWASYMITTPMATIYLGGDSGYFKGYREIGEHFPAIDYALLPITAYEPRWFMHYPHMDTKEAIRAFNDLGARYFIPSQWGTFHLGDNPLGLPVLDLRRDIKELKENGERYLILDIGEIRLL